MNWIIYGAGAIGTYIGVSLITHGENVVFLDRPQVATQLRQQGLRLSTHGQDQRILHPDTFTSLDQVLSLGSFDVVIFAMKSYDNQEALENIRPYAAKFPPILCLQNGVENEAEIEQVLGKEKVIAGTITSSVGRRSAGDIILERQRGIGIADGHPLSKQILLAFTNAGINTSLYHEPIAMKWSKMLTNLLANASSAILDITPNEILKHPALYRVEIYQLREALAIMHALNIAPVDLPGTPVRSFSWIVGNLPPAVSQLLLAKIAGKGRGQKMPSFHIDLHSGRQKSEVNYLNGAVVRYGDRCNIPTPVNRWLNQTLLKLTQGSLPIDSYRHQPGKFLADLHEFVFNQPKDSSTDNPII